MLYNKLCMTFCVHYLLNNMFEFYNRLKECVVYQFCDFYW